MNRVLTLARPACVHRLGDAERLIEAVTLRIAHAVVNAVDQRGHAALALSGGLTPEPVYDRLGLALLPWRQVAVTLVDEQWVPPVSKHSNQRLLARSLFAGPGGCARFLPLWRPAASPECAAEAADLALARMPWPLDVVLLGMGEDGHIASLFPGSGVLAHALDRRTRRRCIAVPPGAAPGGVARLSLTLSAILDARLILLLIRGEAKRAALEQAIAGCDPSEMPVRAVLRQRRTPVDVFWAP